MLSYKEYLRGRRKVMLLSILIVAFLIISATLGFLYMNGVTLDDFINATDISKLDIEFINGSEDGTLKFYSAEESSSASPEVAYRSEGFKIHNHGDTEFNYIVKLQAKRNKITEIDKKFDIWLSTDPSSTQEAIKLKDYLGTLDAGETNGIFYILATAKDGSDSEHSDDIFSEISIDAIAYRPDSIIQPAH